MQNEKLENGQYDFINASWFRKVFKSIRIFFLQFFNSFKTIERSLEMFNILRFMSQRCQLHLCDSLPISFLGFSLLLQTLSQSRSTGSPNQLIPGVSVNLFLISPGTKVSPTRKKKSKTLKQKSLTQRPENVLFHSPRYNFISLYTQTCG